MLFTAALACGFMPATPAHRRDRDPQEEAPLLDIARENAPRQSGAHAAARVQPAAGASNDAARATFPQDATL
jgi:hypothetical protein